MSAQREDFGPPNIQELAEFDAYFMNLALEQAHLAQARGEVPVGVVMVDPERATIIAQAHNSPIADCDPTAHAEILALRAAGRHCANYRLNGLWLYVTLEPCAMCAAAIAHARVARLIYASEDPKTGAVGAGRNYYETPQCLARPEIHKGVMAAQSTALLQAFFRLRRKKADQS